MKPLNSSEVEGICSYLETWAGFHLQEVEAFEDGILLRLYGDGRSVWLIAEMKPARPILLPLDKRPAISKKTKPLGLFINAHLVGQTLETAELVTSRVLKIGFSNATMEVRLFPHGENILVSAGKKEISWAKPAELKLAEHHDPEARGIRQLVLEWQESRPQPKKAPTVKTGVKSSLGKKKNAIEKLRDEILKKESEKWFEAGEYIKSAQTLRVPEEFDRYIDFSKNLADNIQICFQKAKDLERKIVSSRMRLKNLEEEIAKLGRVLELGLPDEAAPPPKKDLALKTKIKTRKLELEEGRIAYMGKSAADNLELLRKAQAWDYWLHMKDFPGAHVIIRRHRGQEPAPAEIERAARWLAEETPASKRELRPGDRFEVQMSEVRFVKPLKGDRLGRVSVAKPKVLRFKF